MPRTIVPFRDLLYRPYAAGFTHYEHSGTAFYDAIWRPDTNAHVPKRRGWHITNEELLVPPGPLIGPAWEIGGTAGVCIGQTCISVNRAANVIVHSCHL